MCASLTTKETNVAETIQEKTYRLANAVFGEQVDQSFEEVSVDPEFKQVCRLVALAGVEAIREAAKLNSFACGAGAEIITVIDVEDLLNMAKDLETK